MATKKLRSGIKGKNKASVNGKAAGPEFVISAKAKAALLTLGAAIANAEIHSGTTVKDVLMQVKGKRPEEIEVIGAGLEARWKQHSATMTPKERDRVRQAIYTRIGEERAVLRFWTNWYGMTSAKQTVLAKQAEGASSYHAFVSFCRKVNGGAASGKGKGSTGKVQRDARKLKQWSNKTQERVKAVENDVRFAPLAALEKLHSFIGKMIQVRRKIEAKAGAKGGVNVVKLLRKVA